MKKAEKMKREQELLDDHWLWFKRNAVREP